MSKKTKLFKISDIAKKVPNRFKLCVGVAVRARQIQEGARSLIENGHEDDKSIMTALREFDQSKVKLVERAPEPDLMDYETIDTTIEDDVIGELLGGKSSEASETEESDKSSVDTTKNENSEESSDAAEDVVAA